MCKLLGREREIAIINNAIINHPIGAGHIQYFYGRSGTGKTTLCKYIQYEILPQNQSNFIQVSLDIQNFDVSTEYKTIRFFYEQLKKDGRFSFPNFELACAYLAQTRDGEVYKLDNPHIEIEIINEFLDLVGGLVTCGNILSFTCKKVLSSIYNKIQQNKEDTLKSKLDDTDIKDALVEFFIQDFNESLEEMNRLPNDAFPYHVIFLIDSFEKRSHYDTQDWFTEKLLANLHYTIWFIFGTEEKFSLTANGIEWSSHEIKVFNDEDTEKYLIQHGIGNKDARKRIVQMSGGLPAAIQIFVQIYRKEDRLDSNLCIKGYQALFYHYFNKHLNEENRSIIKKLAVFKQWDRSVYHYISGNRLDNELEWLVDNTALVERIDNTHEARDDIYRLVNIVKETILAVLDERGDPILTDGYKIKYRYYRDQVDKLVSEIDQLRKANQPIQNRIYKQLEEYSKEAFQGAIIGYSCGSEFDEYSAWCIKTEQFMTKVGFFNLKSTLINDYINGVLQRDGFRFDVGKNRFYLDAVRDLVWSYRYTGEWDKAINNAGRYYLESLKRYGIFDVHIPFCFYLLGLTYRDVYDLQTAELLLEQGLSLYSKLEENMRESLERKYNSDKEKVEEALHPDSDESVKVLAGNVLGHIKIDFGKFDEALELLENAQMARLKNRAVGQQIGYSNLAKLYFYWAQSEIQKDRTSKKALEYFGKVNGFLDCTLEEIPNINDIERINIKTRKITLALAQCIAQKIFAEIDIGVWADFYDELEQTKDELDKLEQPSSTKPYILSIENNLAVIHALLKDFCKAQQLFSDCLSKKYQYYEIGKKDNESLNISDRIKRCMKMRPAINDTVQNLKTIGRYTENPNRPFNPYQFILQF